MAEAGNFTWKFCRSSSIWNFSEIIDGSFPEFSECFQQTLLVWIPCGVLLLSFPFYLYYLYKQSNGKINIASPCCCFHVAKLLVNVLLICLVLVELVYQTQVQEDFPIAIAIACSLKIVAFMLSGLLTHILRIKGIHTSGLLFLFWLLMVVAGIIPTYTKILSEDYKTDLFLFVTFFCYFPLLILQLLLHCFAEHKLYILDNEEKEQCPEGSVSILNQLYFWWMNGLVVKAFKRPLEIDDLWTLNPWDKSQVLAPKLETAWEKEVTKSLNNDGSMSLSGSSNSTASQFNNRSFVSTFTEKTPLLLESETDKNSLRIKNGYGKPDIPKHKPSLFQALFKTFGPTYGCAVIFKSVSDVLQFINPVLLQYIINYADNRDSLPQWRGYVPAILMLSVALVQSVFYHQNLKIGMTVGMRIRSALISAIYKKAMTMSSETQKGTTLGETVNLMSVDCQRIQDTFNYLWSLFTVPLQVTIGIYLLWTYVELGPSCLAGLAVLMLMVPLNSFVAVKQRKFQGLVLRYKGQRIKLFSEILNGMKVLKMYAWEPSFTEKVLAIRQQELTRLKHIAYLQGFTTFCFLLAPFVVMLATFATYVVTSETHTLRADQAFVALALFNILRVPVNLLSQLISYGVQAMVSIKRIQNYLSGTDLDPNNVHFTDINDYAVEVNHGTFIWDREMPQPTLKDIHFHIPDGQLVAVVGQVGSGKSSLISSLLGDLNKLQGNVTVKGKVAYVPQAAWIQNNTLMNNILFGKQLLAKKYKKVIEACGLGPDLEMLPGGDQIEIGEKGINISGGQKQRISLARAVYSNSNVYLMDDPLSAVDAHVGKHIFTKVIGPKGLLKNKTRVLVTHGIQWLPMMDNILVMVNGKISEFGSYEDLISHDGPFAQFLKEYFLEDEEEDEQIDPEVRAMKDKIFQQVETVTSDGLTSDDQRSLPLSLRRASVSRRGSRLLKRKEEVRKPVITNTKQQLIQQETAKVGGVKMEVFTSYFGAAGWWAVALIMVLFSGFHATSIFSNFWLTFWTEDSFLLNKSLEGTPEFIDRSYDYLLIYGLLGVLQAVLVLIYGLMLAVRMVVAAGKLHQKMLLTIMRCPMTFFDTTPIGRIINRFSSDVDIMDNNLPITCRISLNTFFLSLSTVIVVSVNTPQFLIIIVPVAVLYFIILKFYIPTSRQLKRLESMTRSPVYNHFSESVSGASVIRAYRAQDRFIKESMDRVDQNLVFYYAYFVSARWLGVRLELLGNLLILAAALFGVFSPGQSGAVVGLSISYALQATSVLNVLVVNISDLQSNTVSVERIKEYSEVQSEAEWYCKNPPPPGWPRQGEIIFQDYKMRYRHDLDLVLKGISVNIRHGEKIGIVGRTGAGKSSLTLSLFRLIEGTGGSIIIDGVRIADIGLHNLRDKLTILPQDPVLFSGPLRMNLDPFDQYNDDQLWTALQQAHLSEFIKTLPGMLSYQCGEGGQNFSVGQRQLVCLARTLLKKTNVLILDEATAAVDMQTDALIQETIHNEFYDCTVLSIAHRLNTVLDYDKVMVLSNGQIAEFDSPAKLLSNQDSVFYGMAADAKLVNNFQNGGSKES